MSLEESVAKAREQESVERAHLRGWLKQARRLLVKVGKDASMPESLLEEIQEFLRLTK